MKQSVLLAALTAVMIAGATGCGPAQPTAAGADTAQSSAVKQVESTTTALAAEQAAEPLAAKEGGKLMEGVLSALPKSGVVHMSDKEGSTFQVDASDEGVGRIWDLLLAQNYAPLQVTDELFQGQYSLISLRYTADEDYLIRLYGCAKDHPAYPGQTVIDLENTAEGEGGFAGYTTQLTLFEQLSVMLNNMKNAFSLVLDRATVQLATGELADEQMTAWQQNGNHVMVAFSGKDGAVQMLFNESDGSLLGTTRVAEPVTRMDLTREESGYDYQMFTASRVIYKNSKEPLAEKQYTLPASVKPLAWKDSGGDFDLKYEKLIWAEDAGAYLSQADGSGAKQLVANSELRSLAGALAPEGELMVVAPRLLNKGEQAVLPVAVGEKLVGVVLVDLEANKKTGYFDVFGEEYRSIAYPDNRSFAAAGERDITVVDAATGDRKRLPFTYDEKATWYSGDYKNFVVAQPEDGKLFQSYLVTARKSLDRSRPFLGVKGKGTFRVLGVSERNVLIMTQENASPRYSLVSLNLT